MNSLSWFATTVVLATFVTSSAQAAPMPQARWTIMVYMSGDNNLEDYIVNDIEQELGLAGSNANVRIVALAPFVIDDAMKAMRRQPPKA